MASITLYNASVPIFKNGITAAKNILLKAVDHYGANTTSEIIKASLAADMIPLPHHVQIISNIAKAAMFRISGIPSNESWADDEDTVEKLIERCDKTLAFLDKWTPEQLNGGGGPDNRVQIGFRGGVLKGKTLDADAQGYLYSHGIPFFFFHLQIVYSILRMKGVPLGYADFMTPYLAQHLVTTENA